jgi:mannuronan 5-epimerase
MRAALLSVYLLGALSLLLAVPPAAAQDPRPSAARGGFVWPPRPASTLDVNDDGQVSAVDALCVLRNVAGLSASTGCPQPLPRPDPNGDGGTSATDALCVLRSVAGLVATTACPTAPAPAPTPQPPPPAGGADIRQRAPAVLADTSYPVPAGAIVVATGGADGNPGTTAAPLRTIQRAVTLARDGDTIVLRQGEYREHVRINGKAVTLQPYPGEQVWIKGSDVVTGWVADGDAWRVDGWSVRLPPAIGDILDLANPIAAYPDQVFIDGRPLAQVSSRTRVTAGTFFVDPSARMLVIGDDPAGRTVEASARPNVLEVYGGTGTVIRGLGFAHAGSTATNASGAVTVHGDAANVTVEASTFARNAAAGLQVGPSRGVVVRSNTLALNGLVGLDSWGTPVDLLIEGNRVYQNNTERFSVYYAAAGIKVNGARGVTIRDNVVEQNYATGIWCDNSCLNVTVARNAVRGNQLYGIMIELSARAVVASNLVVEHANAGGVYIIDASEAQVYNNTLVNNLRSINVTDGPRVNEDAAEVALGITWQTRAVTIKNNVLSHANASNQHMVGVYHEQASVAATELIAAIDANVYYRRSAASPSMTQRWGRQGGDSLYYSSVQQFRVATGLEEKAVGIDNALTNPVFESESAGDYRIARGSAAAASGEPLPANVAAAIGVAPGVPVDRGAITWPGATLAQP